MDMKKYGRQSAFLRLDDVRQPRIETIALVKEGRYGKPDVYFESGKVLSLNATNTETLIAAYGADSDLWVTKKARLYAGTINYQNEDKAAVLVPLSQHIRVTDRAKTCIVLLPRRCLIVVAKPH
jgi:uncharacterized protein YdaL